MNAHLTSRTPARFTSFCSATPALQPRVSPLQLADRILSLAQAADRAGHPAAAAQLLDVMNAVLDRPH